ncbi:MAG: hypothetical protein ABI895_35200 [Deltaproteobacteria bacterium]
MANKRKRAPSRSRDEWIELVKGWKASGLSAAQLANEHGLKAKALSTWQWRGWLEARGREVGMAQGPHPRRCSAKCCWSSATCAGNPVARRIRA